MGWGFRLEGGIGRFWRGCREEVNKAFKCSNKKGLQNAVFQAFATLCAEEEGFEPPVPHSTAVFKTAAINRSAIPP